jgi:hypothetical protein
MADNLFGEARQFNLHTAGTDMVEVGGTVFASGSGAVLVGGFLETGASAVGALAVGGGTPHDAVDSGYPIKIGGKVSTARPTGPVSGDRADAWSAASGALIVGILSGDTHAGSDGSNLSGLTSPVSYSAGPIATGSFVFNGSTWDRARSGGVTGFQGVSGDTAHDAVDAGYPIKIGGYANSSAPASASSGDRVNAWFDLTGKQQVSVVAPANSAIADSTAGNVPVFQASGASHTNLTGALALAYNGSAWDRVRSIDGFKTAAASPDVGLQAAQLADRRFTAVSLGATVGNTQQWDTNGGAIAVIYCGTSTTGTYTFEVSGDGTNFIAAEVWDIATETDVSGTNLTPTSTKVYRIKVAGYRKVQARTVTTLGGTVSLTTSVTSWQLTQTPQGNVVHDGVDSGNPLKIGGYAKAAAPTAVSADGDRVNAWFDLRGQLQVTLRDTSGAYVTPGGGTQYVEDAVLGAVGSATGTLALGRASAAVPTAVSADADAVAQWMSRYGVAASMLASSTGTLVGVSAETTTNVLAVGGGVAHDAVDAGNPIKIGGKARSSSPAAVADADRVDALFGLRGQLVTAVPGSAASDGISNSVVLITEHPYATASYQITPNANLVFGGTAWDRLRSIPGSDGFAPTGLLGTGTLLFNGSTWDRARSGGATGFQGISGDTAHDAADAGYPQKIGGHAYSGAPAAVSATNDRVDAAFTLRGALHSYLVDSSGNALSVGGGTQYTEDVAITANAGIGNLMIGRRDDALSTLTPVEGDAVGLRVGDKGALWVQISDGSGAQITSFGGGTQYAADTAIGVTPTGTLSIGRGSTAIPTAMTADGDAVGLWASLNGALNVILRDTSGVAVQADTQYSEDAALAANAGVGTLMLGRRDDALSTLTPAADDAVGLRVGDKGALWVQISDGSGNQITSFGGGTQYVEDAALGATPTGTLSMGYGSTALPTAVGTDGDAVSLWASLNGALNVILRDTAGAAVATGTQYAADSAAGYAATGTMSLAVAKAAAPSDMSADGDAVELWALRNGSQVVNLASGGTLIGGTANGLYAQGPTAVDSAIAANPLTIGARASTAQPTAMSADGDVVNLWANRQGAQVITAAPHVGLTGSPWTLASKTAQYSSTQTSAVLQAGAAGETIVVTKVQIQAGGTTAGALQLYFGTGAYSRGTSRAIFDGEFAPSATLKPGVVMDGPFIAGATGDDVLVTTSAAINPLTVTIWYYIVT